MAGTDTILPVEKYQVVTSLTDARNASKFCIIELQEETLSRRPRWVVYIPDAGTESNAVKVARLLNEEHRLIQISRANRGTT